MASVDFAKQKSAVSAKAVFRHCASDTREKSKHKNQQIDTSKTKENFSVKVTDYSSVCKAYDDRMKEVEKTNTNKRKDRVTLVTLEYAIPDEIPYDKHEEYVKKVNEIVESMYGSENVLGWYVHRDEIHDYTDKDGQRRTSKNHAHGFVVPELNGQLNAKQCSSRKNMVALNNAIDDMTKRDYGCTFKVGGKKNSKTVEELKKESTLIEKLQAENRALRAENEHLKAVLQSVREKPAEAKKEPVKAKESPVEAYKRSREHTGRYSKPTEKPVRAVEPVSQAQRVNSAPKAEKHVKTQNTASQDVIEQPVEVVEVSERRSVDMERVMQFQREQARKKQEKQKQAQGGTSSLLAHTIGALGQASMDRARDLEDISEKIARNGKSEDDYGYDY